jgi:hypothetical protein
MIVVAPLFVILGFVVLILALAVISNSPLAERYGPLPMGITIVVVVVLLYVVMKGV